MKKKKWCNTNRKIHYVYNNLYYKYNNVIILLLHYCHLY